MNIDLVDVVRLTCQAEEGNPAAKFVLAFLTGEREVVRGPLGDYWYPTSRDEVVSMGLTMSVVLHGGVVHIPSRDLWEWMRSYAVGRERPHTQPEAWVYRCEGGRYINTEEVWRCWGDARRVHRGP